MMVRVLQAIAVGLALLCAILPRKFHLITSIMALIAALAATAARVVALGVFPIATVTDTLAFTGLVLLLSCIPGALRGRMSRGLATGAAWLLLASILTVPPGGHGPIDPGVAKSTWVLVHVPPILAGYAALAGAFFGGHAIIWHRAFPPKASRTDPATFVHGLSHSCPDKGRATGHRIESSVTGQMLFALAAIAAGTVTGSLWAAEAWGRYWAWDPKETGTLALIVWLAVFALLKAFGSGGPILTAVWSVVSGWMVLCVWTLAGTITKSLHSYGQISSGLAYLLLAAAIAEASFMGVILVVGISDSA